MENFSFRRFIWALFALLSVSMAQQTVIRAARMLDVESGKVIAPAVIVVEGDRIVAVNPEKEPGDAGVIELGEATLMPGLMDMHTHLSGEFHAKRYMEQFYMNEADLAYRSTVYARRTLLAGFTTVRELGGPISNALRDAIKKGWVDGPRIFSAGKSIAATGGVLSTAKNGQNPQFTMEELKAIIETANDYGMHGAEGIKRAIIAGVRSIEHGSLMDGEGIRLMKKHGTW